MPIERARPLRRRTVAGCAIRRIWFKLSIYVYPLVIESSIIYEVDVDGYVHVVPVTPKGSKLFLETIDPSRKATRKAKGGRAE